ncbi:hypothetical protein NIES2119_24800 [[Phormidium ambiguum] IAM M-71]|uniref:Uncharacterized protein n=1 Tax=[Phormidium ambiguum] IAM M-71 TaxID=454136 RepID=A0A1U7I8Y5_9CYAN|nr:hypothetical protein [Phormidium ambiguum]OKH32957.1 hypothetical protein NIES2119_24800 [Phormidium ambiguum IAM M-71]
MDLDQQIQVLIDSAPPDGRIPQAMQAIAPALKLVASQLEHPQYYVLQTLDEAWLLTTFNNPEQPQETQHILYAFPTLQDLTTQTGILEDPEVMAVPVPVTHILFQMVGMDTVDSAIFFETPGNLSEGVQLHREDLQNLVQSYLEQGSPAPQSPPGSVPPNIA